MRGGWSMVEKEAWRVNRDRGTSTSAGEQFYRGTQTQQGARSRDGYALVGKILGAALLATAIAVFGKALLLVWRWILS